MTDWWDELDKTMPEVLKGLRVGIYGSAGAPYHHAALIALWGGVPAIVRAEDIRAGCLESLDVLVMPGGGLRAMVGQLEPLGVEGARCIRDWVAAGGMYIGSCAGAFLPASVGRGFWEAHPEAAALHMVDCPLVNGGDSEFESLTSPGVGVLEVDVVDHHHWLVASMPNAFELVHYNGPLFDSERWLQTSGQHAVSGVSSTMLAVQAAARPIGTTSLFTPSEQFLGEGEPKTITTCLEHDALTALSSGFGDGTVVLFGSHPEFGFDVLQLGWRKGVMLFANALRYQGQKAANNTRDVMPRVSSVTEATPTVALAKLANEVRENGRLFAKLRNCNVRGWLATAPCFLGRTPEQLWQEALIHAETVSGQTATYLEQLAGRPLSAAAVAWLEDQPHANQDVGFMGLTILVQQVRKMLLAGQASLDTNPKPLNFAYDGLDWHPYHLLVGSYLSAAGLAAATLLSSATLGRLVADDSRDLLPLLIDVDHSDIPVAARLHQDLMAEHKY